MPRRHILASLLAVAVVGCTSGPAASPSRIPSLEPTQRTPSPRTTPSKPGLPVFAPDEPLLLYALRTDLGGGIFVMQPDGTDRQQLATDVLPGVHKAPGWSHDGRSVVFVDERAAKIWIAHLDGSPTRAMPGCDGGICDNPSWSPDSTRIAYVRIEDAPGMTGPAAIGIEVVELATGEVTPVVRLERPLLADGPRWSADGSEIVFQVDRLDERADETGAAVAVVAATGGEPRYLTDFGQFASAPDWGWVTDEIVFSVELLGLRPPAERGDETWDLFGIQPDGSGQRRITNLADGERLHGPRWTPDGAWIIAKQFQADTMTGGGRRIDPVTGAVEPYLTGLEETSPRVRPAP